MDRPRIHAFVACASISRSSGTELKLRGHESPALTVALQAMLTDTPASAADTVTGGSPLRQASESCSTSAFVNVALK